jgi:hypothetical protein
MITFTKKADAQPAPKDIEENRFDQIRKAAKDQQRKGASDAIRRRDAATGEDTSG